MMVALPLLAQTHASAGPVDRMPPPPVQREFLSTDGSVRLRIRATDAAWRKASVVGRLDRLTAQGTLRATLWERPLPQAYGPRFAVVGVQAQVLLVDEWIHTPSLLALQLLDPQGEPRKVWSFDALAALLGVSGRALSQAATAGPWVGSAPRLDATGRTVLIGAAGRTLVIELASGHLEVQG